jgi:hypothetical protein
VWTVPRFYFHIVRDGVRFEDPEGTELSTIAAARDEAVAAAYEIAANAVRQGVAVDQVFELADEAGNVLLTLPFPKVGISR